MHALHYHAFMVPSSNLIDAGLVNNYGKYIVEFLIRGVMGSVWFSVMD